eukprot:m.48424 g.48424  ORF g.48424 m.48424 type:complete len:85 (+) comp33880_c0_seq18:2597-2851(+)
MEELHQPVLYLEFSHTRLDRRKRRYVMESWPQSLDVLKLLRKSIASRTAVRSIQPRYEVQAVDIMTHSKGEQLPLTLPLSHSPP